MEQILANEELLALLPDNVEHAAGKITERIYDNAGSDYTPTKFLIRAYVAMLHHRGKSYTLLTWLIQSLFAIIGHLMFYNSLDINTLKDMLPLDVTSKVLLILYLGYNSYGVINELVIYLNLWSWCLAWNGVWGTLVQNWLASRGYGYIYGYAMIMGLGLPILYGCYMIYHLARQCIRKTRKFGNNTVTFSSGL